MLERPAVRQRVELKTITTKIGSGATPRGGKESYKTEGLPLIRSLNVYDFSFERADLAFIDEKQARQLDHVTVHKNDILLNITGASVARCCMVPDDLTPARVNQHVAIVRVDDSKADPRFVFYTINSPRYKKHLLALGQGGATREALTKETIERFEVELPPLRIQKRIGTVLAAYDGLIENNTRRIKLLEQMAQMIYREWFVKFRFPGHEEVRMIESNLFLMPEEWNLLRVSDFGTVVTGKTPSTARPEFFGDEVPFIKTPDMHGNIFCIEVTDHLSQAGADSQKNKTIPPNTLIVNCIGALAGSVSITTKPSQTNQQINSVVIENIYTREFLYFSLVSLRDTLRSIGSNGATMINVNKNKFENLSITTPPTALLQLFHKRIFPIFELIRNLQARNVTLRLSRDILLPKLISGEIPVDVPTKLAEQPI